MGVHKQSVSFTDAACAYARELVERGDYPNVSAAVSGDGRRSATSCASPRSDPASPRRPRAGASATAQGTARISVVFRHDPEADRLYLALVAFGGQDRTTRPAARTQHFGA